MASRGNTADVVNLAFGEAQVRSGFRIVSASECAGGPIEIEFFTQIIGGGPRYLQIAGDRMRVRPGGLSFTATFAGVPLADPAGNLPYMGGPAGVVQIAADRPWSQVIVLNEFVCLESTLELLAPGASGDLVVNCQRPLPLAADEQAALKSEIDAPLVEGRLALELRRDDAQLAALVEQLLADVLHGQPEKRERPLKLLLSLRAPAAMARWRTLVDHADPLIAERARERLWNTERAR